MKAKLLKEQMGVPAGAELEVMETGRSWTLVAPSGMTIVVAACDLEVTETDTSSSLEYGDGSGYRSLSKPLLLVTDEYQDLPTEPLSTEPLSDPLPTGMPDGPVDPTDPPLLVNIFGGDPQPDDDDLDGELLPAPQDPCEGDESCGSCQ